MAELNPAKVIRKVRQRMELSQEGLSRLLNATKGAVQHWERGRNKPDIARLNVLRQLCPPSAERRELDALIRQMQADVAPLPGVKSGKAALAAAYTGPRGTGRKAAFPTESYTLLRRENNRLRKQVAKLETTLARRNEQVRILEDLTKELEKNLARLRGGPSSANDSAHGSPPSA